VNSRATNRGANNYHRYWLAAAAAAVAVAVAVLHLAAFQISRIFALNDGGT
jgi:hypothetical protein